MANSICFFSSPPPPTFCLLQSPGQSVKPPLFFPIGDKKSEVFKTCKSKSFEIQATNGTQTPKVSSIVCQKCEGNGAVACSQCKGGGVNLTDHFNGQFKAGGLCWLCRGKKEVLCGECNGAGFIGGFLSTFDE
ncbi:DnaJ/Hsp40 cysteine-rich domain superfamily protein [Raphanus sativus]|uniref:Protein BUNDLE SHEATH DEFECTIVE 2, chloroplastic n=1 Tax=Raphanus sativus TaxID=3726 RepID=A0A6J0NPE8_RAPSA|nr:protein BUNDLE SHEATH DEFECTIVE 2, chloroplastic [Raphanus sativus]KAJ4895633.1 DnaJ/Hsp40 cysteine-rich domain superfamily protein [Raphanus sativus]